MLSPVTVVLRSVIQVRAGRDDHLREKTVSGSSCEDWTATLISDFCTNPNPGTMISSQGLLQKCIYLQKRSKTDNVRVTPSSPPFPLPLPPPSALTAGLTSEDPSLELEQELRSDCETGSSTATPATPDSQMDCPSPCDLTTLLQAEEETPDNKDH
ncbi:hypothetical protein JZ751_029298 [Albula glossodonta]|uniref:Uncharacterized protein n=1 Tax=Albula glossodonta TaxID=121402 RepID=A0A8T2PCQ1_9TELE|nr:hypothetical protein JZ751_029298 [Albula glossodonta]